MKISRLLKEKIYNLRISTCLRNSGLVEGKFVARSKYNFDIHTYIVFIVVTVKTRPQTNALFSFNVTVKSQKISRLLKEKYIVILHTQHMDRSLWS